MTRPMYCPNGECSNHIKLFGTGGWYQKAGTYRTRAFGEVQRYKCRTCGKTFSDQSFSIDYYAKKNVDYTTLYWLVSSSISLNAVGRALNISFSTVANRLERMRRNFWTGIPYVAERMETEPKDAG